MPTLYSYCIPYDDGAAPNPFWGVCTLVICKPAIRRTANIGDWIVGTGSTHSPIGNISGKVVYAMQVTEKMTMPQYEIYAHEHIPNKIPRRNDRDVRRRLGDAIYDFSFDPPNIRLSVHTIKNREKDLGGKYALLSTNFFYFGDKPVQLPSELLEIAQQQQGHRSRLNEKYFDLFVRWLFGLGLKPNQLYGNPPFKPLGAVNSPTNTHPFC